MGEIRRIAWLRLASSIGISLLALAPAGAQSLELDIDFADGAKSASMPFEMASSKVHVRGEFAENSPVWLLLDSGANMSILDRAFADRLGLALRGEGTTDSAFGGASFSFAFARAPALSFPGVEIASRAVAVIDRKTQGANGHASAGLLGADIFGAFVVDVDYPNRVMTLHDPGFFEYRGPGVELPVTFDENGKWRINAVLALNGRKIPARLIVDTGSRGTIAFTAPFAARHGFLEALPEKVLATVGVGVGGEVRHWAGELEGLGLGELALGPMPVTWPPEGAKGVSGRVDRDGILGGTILERSRVIFDHHRARLIVEPASATRAFEWDASGLFLTSEGVNFEIIRVLSVAAGTPGDGSGLRISDEIVAIDGRPVAELTLDGVRRLFRIPGQTYRLAVQRGSVAVEVELVTRRLI